LSDRLLWCDLAGAGIVYTFSVAWPPNVEESQTGTPQVIAIVELTEGPRVTTRIIGVDARNVNVGLPVRAYFAHGSDGMTLLYFTPDLGPNRSISKRGSG
jgi:uncharacterized OB-fold protein